MDAVCPAVRPVREVRLLLQGRPGHTGAAVPPPSPFSTCIIVATRDAGSGSGGDSIFPPRVFFRAGENKLFAFLEDRQLQPVIGYGGKIPAFQVTARDEGERRCLYPSERMVPSSGGHAEREARVVSDDPVGFPPCPACQIQVFIETVRSEVEERLADRIVRQRGKPQAFGFPLEAQIAIKVAGDQLPPHGRYRLP